MSAARPARGHHKSETGRGTLPEGWRRWRGRVAWGLAIIGALLFVAGNIGARAGFVVLPFDPHHVYAQFGGAALLIIGVMWATGGRK